MRRRFTRTAILFVIVPVLGCGGGGDPEPEVIPPWLKVEFGTNVDEYGGQGGEEPGLFTYSFPDAPGTLPDESDPMVRIPQSLDNPPIVPPPGFDFPNFTLTSSWPGQSTTANWAGGFRLLGLPSLHVNQDAGSPAGVLQAVWQPHCGSGADGPWESRLVTTPGPVIATPLNTDAIPGSSINGDGIYEFTDFTLRENDTLNVTGANPLVIFCRGNFAVESGAQIFLNGTPGGSGLDTDGNVAYTHISSIPVGGRGGAGGAGGGQGGHGADPVGLGTLVASDGGMYATLFGPGLTAGGGGGIAVPTGGGGGGMRDNGQSGTNAAGGVGGAAGLQANDFQFKRELTQFEPDRTYQPYANGSGGTGGGGGGANDTGTVGTAENGDHGGGGGGGGGGGLYVIACGTITIDGSIFANGGPGGSTYAVTGQDISGGIVRGLLTPGTTDGAGGPGGGGSGGGIFLCGLEGVTIDVGATILAMGGAGGTSGLTDPGGGTGLELVGGDGSPGIIVLAARDSVTGVTLGGTMNPPPEIVDYHPTIELDSQGMTRWFDLGADPIQYESFRWTSNFANLHAAGLDQGTEYHALLEIQGADNISSSTAGGPPNQAQGLTPWYQINANDYLETRVEFNPALPAEACPIDNKRWMRMRWRFHVPETYPAWPGGPPLQPLPRVLDTSVEKAGP